MFCPQTISINVETNPQLGFFRVWKGPIHAMAHIKSICLDTELIDGPALTTLSRRLSSFSVRLPKVFKSGTTGTRLTVEKYMYKSFLEFCCGILFLEVSFLGPQAIYISLAYISVNGLRNNTYLCWRCCARSDRYQFLALNFWISGTTN